MTHSDSDFDSSGDCVTVDGDEHGLQASSECWAKADNRDLTFEGTASATSYYDPRYSGCPTNYTYSIDEISVSTTLGGVYNKKTMDISAPPGYTVSYEKAEATLSDERTDEESLTLHHNEDAVHMTAQDCWQSAYQDDTMGFHFPNDTYYLGTYIELDVGHCL